MWKGTSIALVALLWALVGAFPPDLPARSQNRVDSIPELNGVWSRGRCVEPNSNCTAIGAEHEALTDRAKAFRTALDELAVPKYDCSPTPLPHLFTDPYAYQIEQLEDRVILTYEKDDVVRTIWLEDHDHPQPKTGEFFAHGYSVGLYQENALVVVTTRFSFGPAGLDNDYNLPSSTQKRITERYSLEGDRLRLEVTTEDPVFLRAPLGFVLESQRVDAPLPLPWNCDPEAAQETLILSPSKYPEDPPVIRRR